MVSDEGEVVATSDKRGLRLLDREQPLRRWISAEKWHDLEDWR